MPEVIKIDELVPDEIIFNHKGVDYRLPGDIDVETTFTLQQLLVDLSHAEEAAIRAQADRLQAVKGAAIDRANRRVDVALATQKRVTLKVEQEILALFKINHPDLEKLPFGAAGFQTVLAHVLVKLGFGTVEPEDGNPPTPAPTKKTPAGRKTSRRST